MQVGGGLRLQQAFAAAAACTARSRAPCGRPARTGTRPAVGLPAGPAPGDLYGKFTWRIDNFSEVSKRELRSTTFEVGSYKW